MPLPLRHRLATQQARRLETSTGDHVDTESHEAWTLEFGEFPGGTTTAMVCKYPDAIDEGMDVALPYYCLAHHRTIWWCLNMSVLWCDGGPPDYAYHWWPNGLAPAVS